MVYIFESEGFTGLFTGEFDADYGPVEWEDALDIMVIAPR